MLAALNATGEINETTVSKILEDYKLTGTEIEKVILQAVKQGKSYDEIGALVDDGVEPKRILWGTDMPVTYWWYNVREKEKIPSIGKELLTEFYKRNHYPAASQSL